MNYKDALLLVGQSVSVWTAANGEYIGTLAEIIRSPGRPWRAKVLITGVVRPACHYEAGKICRRGFRPGEEIEAGGVNIVPTDVTGTTYRKAVESDIEQWSQWLANNPEGRYAHVQKPSLIAAKLVLDWEQAREAGASWPTYNEMAAQFRQVFHP